LKSRDAVKLAAEEVQAYGVESDAVWLARAAAMTVGEACLRQGRQSSCSRSAGSVLSPWETPARDEHWRLLSSMMSSSMRRRMEILRVPYSRSRRRLTKSILDGRRNSADTRKSSVQVSTSIGREGSSEAVVGAIRARRLAS
jgi:hypothetical protein